MKKIHIVNEQEEIIISGDDLECFPTWQKARDALIRQIEEKIYDPDLTIEFFSYKKEKIP